MGKNRKNDLAMFVLLLVFTIVGTVYSTILFIASFEDGEEITISYDEKSSLGYKVWLLDNDFYSSEYLDEQYNVVASSIKEIEIDFEYLLNTSDFVRGVSYYTINSRIVAHQRGDLSERKIWDHEKLIKDKSITVYDVDSMVIKNNDNFKINYQEYKKLMDDYKSKYAVSLTGNLIIEIDIKTDLDYEKFNNKIDLEKRRMTVTIPLTESVVNITKSEIKNNNQVLIEKNASEINYLKLCLSVLAFALGLCLCVFLGITLVKLVGIDSKFDKELKKILKTYGSVIVNVNEINFDNKKDYLMVSSFSELLDAQQELKKPILFYNVKPNRKVLFLIKYEKDVLAYEMNSNLYEANTKKEKSDKND